MRTVIGQHLRKCARQMRIDTLLTLLSFLGIIALVTVCYPTRFVLIGCYILLALIIHTGVMVYCRRLWTMRIRKWQAMDQLCVLLEKAGSVATLSGEILFSLPESEGTVEEILQSQPTSS